MPKNVRLHLYRKSAEGLMKNHEFKVMILIPVGLVSDFSKPPHCIQATEPPQVSTSNNVLTAKPMASRPRIAGPPLMEIYLTNHTKAVHLILLSRLTWAVVKAPSHLGQFIRPTSWTRPNSPLQSISGSIPRLPTGGNFSKEGQRIEAEFAAGFSTLRSRE